MHINRFRSVGHENNITKEFLINYSYAFKKSPAAKNAHANYSNTPMSPKVNMNTFSFIIIDELPKIELDSNI